MPDDQSTPIKALCLHDGDSIPVLGLGTYRMKTEEVLRPVVREAILSGYRLIDTATVYRNEEILGKIIKEILSDSSSFGGLERKDLFITSKLSPQDQGYEKCYNAVIDSLNSIGLEYFDLYLIHWPGTAKKKLSDPVNRENRHESYRALEQLYREGKIRHIGISNFTARHMEELLATCTIVPHVHQFELHPRLVQQDLLRLCAKYKIQVQAYSSLGEGRLLEDKEIREIAEQNGLSSAQVLLRWAVQHGWAVIPKSSNPGRVRMNASIFAFELSEEAMSALDKLHETQEQRFCWDPTDVF